MPISILEVGRVFTVGAFFFMENKIWEDVVGWEGLYQVSNFGEIRSLDRKTGGPTKHGRVVKGKLRKPLIVRGYLSINLIDKKSGKSTRNGVHVFVAHAFIPNPENKPCVNHKDGNKQNNHVSNLEWCTHRENSIHAWSIGLNKPYSPTKEHRDKLRKSALIHKSLQKWQNENKDKMKQMALLASLLQAKKVNQLSKDGTFIKTWESAAEANRVMGVSASSISRCAKGKIKTSGGFKWEYA